MASGFSFSLEDTRCEGCHSDDSAHVSYRVEVRQKLCDGCAHEKKDSINAAEWLCKKHVMDKAKIFCLTHDIPICEACAITTHSKSTCSLGDIDDILEDRKDYLVRLIEMSKTNEDTFTHQMSTVDEELAGIGQHFAKEEEKLRLAYEGEMKKLTKAFEDRQQTLKKASVRLQKTTENLRVQPEKKYKDLVTMRARAEELLTNKEDLMKDFQEFNSSVTCLTSKIQPDHNLKIVKQIVGVARKVTFTEADSQAIGKIEIPEETWVPNNEYNPEIGKLSYMMGAIGGTEVVIKDQDKHSIYVVNIEAKIKKKVMKSNNPHDLWRCVPLWKDGISRIICGSNDGEIVICDRSWKVLTVIRVAESSSVAVAVNKDGLILATAIGSCTIGIYDPTDGKLVRSIEKKTPVYDVCALASGHIVIMNECVEGIDVSVLDDSGETLASKHCHGAGIKSLVVDRGHDLIYLLSWDRHHSDYKVCVLSTSAEVVAERVAVCEPSFYSPSCAIPRPDRMVIYTDGKILTFRKTKRGFHQLLAEIKLKESADLESSDNHE